MARYNFLFDVLWWYAFCCFFGVAWAWPVPTMPEFLTESSPTTASKAHEMVITTTTSQSVPKQGISFENKDVVNDFQQQQYYPSQPSFRWHRTAETFLLASETSTRSPTASSSSLMPGHAFSTTTLPHIVTSDASLSSSLSPPTPASSKDPISSTLSSNTNNYNLRNLQTLQGTKWRLVVFPKYNTDTAVTFFFGKSSMCPKYTLIFQGFAEQPDKGLVQCTCMSESQDPLASQPSSSQKMNSVQGRWLSKPSEIRQGTVQLSARWKLKNPVRANPTAVSNPNPSDKTRTETIPSHPDSQPSLIFKGFIRADAKTLSSTSGRLQAEMKGTILTSNDETLWGTFQADLISTELTPEESFYLQ